MAERYDDLSDPRNTPDISRRKRTDTPDSAEYTRRGFSADENIVKRQRDLELQPSYVEPIAILPSYLTKPTVRSEWNGIVDSPGGMKSVIPMAMTQHHSHQQHQSINSGDVMNRSTTSSDISGLSIASSLEIIPKPSKSNVNVMSTVVENFDTLFAAAQTTPRYTENLNTTLSDLLKPMFENLTQQLQQNISSQFLTMREEFKEVRDNIKHWREETETLKIQQDQLKTEVTTNKDELSSIKEELAREKDKNRNFQLEMEDLKAADQSRLQDIKYFGRTSNQHTRFLETLDAENRKNNLILLGVPEATPLITGNLSAQTDAEKVSQILSNVGKPDVTVKAMHRLGQPKQPVGGQQPRPRPIKITLENFRDRNEILDASQHINNIGGDNTRLVLRKDTHPAIRREITRLYDTVRHEKGKPENHGKNIWYDRENRCVRMDNQMIDWYQPMYFQ